ncbi:MAG: SCP2 sterol-binding domain-containing protein [Bdellovibrionota bacterium]
MGLPEKYNDPKVFLPDFFKAMQDPECVKEGAKGQKLTIQYSINDAPDLNHWIKIDDGKVTTGKGNADNASATIKMGTGELKTMFTDPQQGQMLFMSGQIQIEGDMSVLMQMGSMISMGRVMKKLGFTK